MTATLGAVAVVAVALLGGSDVGDGPAMSTQVGGSSWLGTDPIGPIITEVVSSNASTLADEDGDQPDWIELHNPTHEPLDLEGYHLSDDGDDPARWPLPAVVLEPDAHLVVFASGKDRRDRDGELHTDFRLAQGDEPVLLVEPDGATIADHIDAIDIPRNASFGRPPTQLSRTCYFAFPSPGGHNTDECFDDTDLGAPTLSHTTGFYDEPFELEITASDPDATIYYTLDGSYPDPDTNPDNTLVYDGPLRIVDRTPQPNTISTIDTTIEPYVGALGLVASAPELIEPVPKATVIRTRSRHSAASTSTFFVGEAVPPSSLPVISLALDPDYLFDHETGIYIAGREAERFADGDDFDKDNLPTYWQIPANYNERGIESERPHVGDLSNSVVLDYCEPVDGCLYQRDVGVRIHGRSSRTFSLKSLRLYARNDYGSRTFSYPFFGDRAPDDHRRLILRSSGTDFRRPATMLIDAYLQDLMSHFEADTQAAQPTVVFINGEYWGIHNLRERYDRHYLEAVHGADPDAVVILEQGHAVASGRANANEHYLRLLDRLTEVEQPDEALVAELEGQIDIDNFFDFVIAHVAVGNRDWPQANARMWREPDGPDTPGTGTRDGRWRWLVFDLDHMGGSSDRFDFEYDVLSDRLQPNDDPEAHDGYPLLFHRLMAVESTRFRFLQRFSDHLNTTFNEERTTAKLESHAALLRPEMGRHIDRWQRLPSTEEWEEHVDRLRDFMQQRPTQQRAHLKEHFGLSGTVSLVLEQDTDRGRLSVNTITIDEATPGITDPRRYEGRFFVGVPLELSARPAEGYRFVRWDGLDGPASTESTLEIRPEDDLNITAVFDSVD